MTAREAVTLDQAPPPKRSFSCLGCLGLSVAAIAAIVVGWILMIPIMYPEYPARYRLTVEVETPQGLKTGSSVIEARYGWQFTAGGITSSVSNSLVGEAVFVDLGDGRNLVVTLTNTAAGRRRTLPGGRANQWEGGSMNAVHLPALVYGFSSHDKKKTPEGIERAKAEGPKAFDPARLPTTLTFLDIGNPKSAQGVDPTDLEATFGPSYRISRAVAEMTDEPLTDEIEERLPWLGDLYRRNLNLDGSSSSFLPPDGPVDVMLGAGDFKVGGW